MDTLRGHESRPHCRDTLLRYAVTLQVCTHPNTDRCADANNDNNHNTGNATRCQHHYTKITRNYRKFTKPGNSFNPQNNRNYTYSYNVPHSANGPIIYCSSDPAGGKDKMTRYPALVAGSRLLSSGGEAANATLLAAFCKDQVPRTCDHALLINNTRSTRPCSLSESFFSTGDTMTLELRVAESTALRCVLCTLLT